MTVSLDLLNTTLEDLKGPATMAFKDAMPIWKDLFEKRATTGSGGDYIKRLHVGSSPVKARGLYSGVEVLPVGMSNVMKELTIEPHQVSAAITIPIKELQRNTGKEAAVRLIEEYPRAVLAALGSDLNKYLLTGTCDSLGVTAPNDLFGYLTLNGEFAAGLNTGTTNGLLDFLTPAAQTAAAQSVQNVTTSTTYNYYNQYGLATSWAADTWRTLMDVYRRCSEFGGEPDLVVMDPGSYGYYAQNRRDIVRLVSLDAKEGNDYLASSFGKARVVAHSDLDPALFAGTGANGVTYVLNTKHWEVVWYSKGITLGKFQESVHDQRVVWAPVDIHFGFVCKNRPAQGCVGGTNVA